MKLLEKYILHNDTLALLPHFNKYGELYTTVIEKYHKFQVKRSPKQILMDNCEYHGSSLRGRIEAAKKVLPKHRLLPVYVSEHFKLCFFPTRSIDHVECQFFSHKGIKRINPHKRGSIIVLENDDKILVPMHPQFLFNKVKNASHLVYTYGNFKERIYQIDIQDFIAEEKGKYDDDNED